MGLSRRISMMDVLTALAGSRRIQLFDMNGHQNYKEISVNVCKGIDIFFARQVQSSSTS